MRSDETKSRRGAALLLEVVVSLTIMVAAMGVLGAQLVGGLRLTAEADLRTRAAAMTDRVLALVEFDPEWQQLVLQEEENEGEFGDRFPGWFWRVAFEPTDVEGLGLVRVEILHQEDPEDQDSIDGAKLIRRVTLLKAAPGRIDLVEDFGMDEEQIAELEEMLPITDFDPTAVDPQALVALATENPELLLEMLPVLMPLLQQFAGRMDTGPGGGMPGPGELAGMGREFGDEFAGEPGAGGTGIEELMRLSEELAGGGAVYGGTGGVRPGEPGGGRGGRGGRGVAGAGPRGGGGRRGGGRAGGAGAAGRTTEYSIEDLLRLRDELQRRGGGR